MTDYRTIDLAIPLRDIERVAEIAPEMPAHQVAEMMRWIAEREPVSVAIPPLTDADAEKLRATLEAGSAPVVLHTLDMGDGRVLTSPAPIPQPIMHETAPAGLPPVREPEPMKLKPEGVAAREMGAAESEDRARLNWSNSEVQTVLDMLNRGETAKAIAAQLGRPVPGTQFMAGKLRKGWRPKNWGKTEKPAPVAASAAAAPQPERKEPQSPVAIAPTTAPVPMPSQPLTGAQRDLMAHIMRLDDDFTPQDDLYLAEAVIGRTPLDVIGDQLGCDIATVRARWVALIGFDPKTVKGGVPLQLQSDLVAVLRQLAERAAA